jgi:hypothetical protein
MMANSFHIRRASRIWWANSLSLVLCLVASSGAVGAEQRAQAHPSGEISGRTGDPPYGTVVASEHPQVRYLLEELITQRLENSQLHADLTAAGARRAEIEKGAREKEAALTAWIAGLRDELAQNEAQLALTTAAREFGARLLDEARAAEASARARRQLAAVETKLKEQDRQMAVVQSVAKDLAQRLRCRLKFPLLDSKRLIARFFITLTVSALYFFNRAACVGDRTEERSLFLFGAHGEQI